MSGTRRPSAAEQFSLTRALPDDPFARIPHALIRDRRLSRFACHILIEILSNTDEWNDNHVPTAANLWQQGREYGHKGEGRGVYYKALAELEECGYLVRTRQRLPDGSVRTNLHYSATPVPSDRLPETGNRSDQGKREFPQVAPTTRNRLPVAGSQKKEDQYGEQNEEKNEDTPHHHQDRHPPWLREALPVLDDDEIDQVLTSVAQAHQPNNLMGYVRTLAASGDLMGYYFECNALPAEHEHEPDLFCDYHRLPYPARGECRGCAADRKAAA